MYEPNVAVYSFNAYTWRLLEVNLEWERWKGVAPIIPVAQQPEFLQSGKSFIVYGAVSHPPDHLYALHRDTISYTIYAGSVTEANKISNLFNGTFRTQDEAADVVNEWLSREADVRPTGGRGIYFSSITSTMTEQAEPREAEDGYVAALVLFDILYTKDEENIIKTFPV